MKRIIRGILTCLTMVSRIPVPWRFRPDYRWFGFFLPIVGIVAGAFFWVLGTLFLLFIRSPLYLIPPVLFLYYAVFNLFHFDGLLDSADALFFQGSRDDRLRIMKDSAIGTYAFFCGGIYLLLKILLLYRCLHYFIVPDAGPWHRSAEVLLFLLFPAFGRCTAAFIPLALKPAREKGLGALLYPYRTAPPIIAGLFLLVLASGVLFLTGRPENGILVCLGGVIVSQGAAFLLVFLPYKSRIGGYTGDTMGACIETGEILYLAAFCLLMIPGGL